MIVLGRVSCHERIIMDLMLWFWGLSTVLRDMFALNAQGRTGT